MYKLGLKLWSINTDVYYEEAKKLYEKKLFDYIELYVVPNSAQTIKKCKKLKKNVKATIRFCINGKEKLRNTKIFRLI